MRIHIAFYSLMLLCLNAYSIEYDFFGMIGPLEEKNIYDIRVGFDSNNQGERIVSIDKDGFDDSVEVLINNARVSSSDYVLNFENYSNITTNYYNQEDPRKGFVITIRNVSILGDIDNSLKILGSLKYTSVRKERHSSIKPFNKIKLWDEFLIGGINFMLIKTSRNEMVFKMDTDKNIEVFFNIISGDDQPKVAYSSEWGAVNGGDMKMHYFLIVKSSTDLNRVSGWGVVNDSLPVINNMSLVSKIKL
ncbi:MAG: hypothetical protein ACI978_000051 [Oleispira sp.]|jgi:hypothetical protein